MYISKKFEDLTISDDFMYQLDKGMDYMQLKQSFVIFVCTFDPFQLGRHIYTFTNRCVEDPDLLLNDGTQKIILNTKGIFDDVRPELKRLLNFIDGRQPEDAFTQDLSEAVESAKRNEKWRLDYMTLQMAYDENTARDLRLVFSAVLNKGSSRGLNRVLLKVLRTQPGGCLLPQNTPMQKFRKSPGFPWRRFRL